MKCPNRKCGRETDRAMYTADKQGKIRHGCPACIHRPTDKHVYTGRKLWAGHEVFTPSQAEQENHKFAESIAKKAASFRRTHRPLRSVSA